MVQIRLFIIEPVLLPVSVSGFMESSPFFDVPLNLPHAGRIARRYVVLGIAIFSAIATPGGDLVSPFVLGGTMYLLFEATVFFIRRTGR